jgi:hypothetical protein
MPGRAGAPRVEMQKSPAEVIGNAAAWAQQAGNLSLGDGRYSMISMNGGSGVCRMAYTGVLAELTVLTTSRKE